MPSLHADGHLYFTTPEIAPILNVSDRTVRRWVTEYFFLEDFSNSKRLIEVQGLQVLALTLSGKVRLHPKAPHRIASELRVKELDRALLFEYALNHFPLHAHNEDRRST